MPVALQCAYLLDPNLLVRRCLPPTDWSDLTTSISQHSPGVAAAAGRRLRRLMFGQLNTCHEVNFIIVTGRMWGVGPSWGAQNATFPRGREWSVECGYQVQHLPPEFRSVSPMIVQGYWWEHQTGHIHHVIRIPTHCHGVTIPPYRCCCVTH